MRLWPLGVLPLSVILAARCGAATAACSEYRPTDVPASLELAQGRALDFAPGGDITPGRFLERPLQTCPVTKNKLLITGEVGAMLVEGALVTDAFRGYDVSVA